MAYPNRQAASRAKQAALIQDFIANILDPGLTRFEAWIEARPSGLEVEIEPYDAPTSRAAYLWNPQHGTLASPLHYVKFEVRVDLRPRAQVVLVAERREDGGWVPEPLLSGPICEFDADRICREMAGTSIRAHFMTLG